MNMKVTDAPVIVEQQFNTSKTQLWSAITEAHEMRQWFFSEIPTFEAREGFTTSFKIAVDDRVFPHIWKITEVIPLEKIVYHWSYDGYEGVGTVIFDLIEKDGGVNLRLTNTVQENFQEGIPEFNRESCQGGWEYFIQKQLKAYIESKK